MRIGLWSVAATLVAVGYAQAAGPAPSFEDRVAAQRAIESVYWSHRIWPEQNPAPKPGLDDVVSEDALREKVRDYLKKSRALETLWDRPLEPADLQAELDRMARDSRRGDVLEELFAALDHDPLLVAECLVRPRLVERWIRDAYATDRQPRDDPSFDAWWERTAPEVEARVDVPGAGYVLPAAAIGCTDDTWMPVPSRAPSGRRGHTAVWTGSEMIVWGGQDAVGYPTTGGRYDPATDTWTETSPPPLPGRAGHTAVWTGTEMIVWGGFNGVYLGTGMRYDPTLDSWTQMSTAPSQRASHTAVWTGSEMIVWGGSNGSVFANLNNGSRYDPSNDSWTATTTTGAPTGRAGHTAVWTGSEMIVWGGESPVFMGSPIFFDSGGRYDPLLDVWTATSTGMNVPQARTEHVGVWTGSEMIVWGGRTGPSTYLASGGRYDPLSDTWSATDTGANLPPARRHAVGVWSGSRMIVWGGDSFSGTTIYHDTGGLYDPVSDAWTATSTGAGNPSGRTQHAGVWTGSELVVWGGVDASAVHLDTGGRLTPGTNSWSPTGIGATVPSGRSGHIAVWTGAEMIVWGGVDGTTSDFLNSGGRYDPATDSWLATGTGANVPSGRHRTVSVWTGDRLVVWGGGEPPVDTGGRYDPVTDTWQTTSTGAGLPAAREDHTAVWTGKEMIVWGGTAGGGMLFDTGGRYDPVEDTWTATGTGANLPTGRSGHSVVWTGKEMIVWGGVDVSYTNTGARYDAEADTWSAMSTMNVPQARRAHTAVWTGTDMIVWGGSNFSSGTVYLNSGGRYDPATDTWSATASSGAPTARDRHTAAWTREELIVWGGSGGAAPLQTGGRYDPLLDAWFPTNLAGAPAGRFGHSAVWADGEMIVWGGANWSGGGRYCACGHRAPGAAALDVAKPTPGSTTARLTWPAVADATGYDVVTGTTSTLVASGGDFASSTGACLAQNQSATTVDDTAVPASGQGAWYLLRGISCGGDGTYDTSGPAQSGPRDAEVAASGVACP